MITKWDEEIYAKSYALRLLLHFIGDICQPLHTIEVVNENFPKGDSGGNGFKLQRKHSIDNLHSLWDSVVYEFRKTTKLVYALLNCLAIRFRGVG